MWMISKIFNYSFRSEMSTSQEKSKRISSFEEGELSKFGTGFWGRAVCFLPNILAAVIFQEPWKVQAVKHQIISQMTKVWVWKGDVFRKARPHKHRDARVLTHRGRSVANGHVCLKPKSLKIQSEIMNPVLNYLGPRYRKDKAHTNIYFQHKSGFGCWEDKITTSSCLTVWQCSRSYKKGDSPVVLERSVL